MARETLVLRDDCGTDHRVEIADDGSIAVGDRLVSVPQIRKGETRAGDRIAWAAQDGDVRWVFLDGHVYTFEVQRANPRLRRLAGQHGGVTAPMPATVLKVVASPGTTVRAGDIVIILEAMKMELPVRAAADGVVAAVRCREGDLVQPGQQLIELTPSSQPSTPSSELPASKGTGEAQ